MKLQLGNVYLEIRVYHGVDRSLWAMAGGANLCNLPAARQRRIKRSIRRRLRYPRLKTDE